MHIDTSKHNFYLRVRAVQEVYLLYDSSITTKYGIWREHIYPTFFISYRTLCKYIDINAKKEIRKIEEEKKRLLELKNEQNARHN